MILNLTKGPENDFKCFLAFRYARNGDDLWSLFCWDGSAMEGWSGRIFNQETFFSAVEDELERQVKGRYRNVNTESVGTLVDHEEHIVVSSDHNRKNFETLNLYLSPRMEKVIGSFLSSAIFSGEVSSMATRFGHFALKDQGSMMDMGVHNQVYLYHFYVRLLHYYKTMRYRFDDIIPYLKKIRARRELIGRIDW